MAATAVLFTAALSSPDSAEANHYTCSHNRHWWLYDGWYHRFAEHYSDPFYGHVHVYDIQRVGETRITEISWICNWA